MTAVARNGARDEVFLTGGSGFVGSHVLRAVLDAGYGVRALTRPGSRPLPEDEACKPVAGDLLRSGELVRQMDGCRYLVHVAALYTFAPAERSRLTRTNVLGTAGILEAARIAGIERAVVTSSSSTVGPVRNGELPSERDWALGDDSVSRYHHSKIEQERAALAARVPSVLILPTTPIGPGDWRPTPTGQMVVDFMRGRIFATLDGGLNVVAVEDVARAHVLALEKGEPRERYLVGGENLLLRELWGRLAVICGRPAPTRRIPYGVAAALGWADELRCRVAARIGGADVTPLVPIEGVHMARDLMFVNDEKARSELAHVPTSVDAALSRAVEWYAGHGYA